jgi:acyl-CoA thioesterase-1
MLRPIVYFVVALFVSVVVWADTAPKRVLVMGDSLSAAYRLREDQGWVALMAQRVAEQNLSLDIVNASVSGATTAAGLRILPARLAEIKPDLVMLELGANDALQGKPLAYIRKNLESLIELSLSHNAKVLVIAVRIPPNYGSAYAEPFYQQYKTLADKHSVFYAPFMLDGVADNPELMMDDGKHPIAEAQALVLDNIWPHFLRAYEADSAQ